MRHRRTGIVVGIIAALVVLNPVGAAANPTDNAEVTAQESRCTETLYERGAFRSVVDPLVPDRFELQSFDPPVAPGAPPYGGPPRVQLLITEYACASTTTVAADSRRDQRDVATIIVSAGITADAGQPTNGAYVLRWATENRLQNDRLNAVGWSSDLLGRRSGLVSSTVTPGGLTQVEYSFVGSRWDHTLTVASPFPFSARDDTTVAFFRDTAAGPLAICYANSGITSAPGFATADLTATPLAELTAARPIFAGFPGPNPYAVTTSLARGDWTSTLTSGSCPDGNDQARSGPAGALTVPSSSAAQEFGQ